MSARRRRMSGEVEQVAEGGVPWQLTSRGRTDVFWTDTKAVGALIARHSLPEPHPGYWASPLALRDHAAFSWMVRSGYVSKWGTPDWERGRVLGVTACGSARTRARLASGING